MRWEVSDAKSSGTDYIGYAETMPVAGAVRELWRKYLEDAAPINADIEWDHLRAELWLDSGRIILYPAVSPFRRRIEKSACQITCPDLLNFFEMLVEAELPDDKIEAALARKEDEVIMLLSTSGLEMKLPERLNRGSVKVLYYGANLKKPIKEDIFSS